MRIEGAPMGRMADRMAVAMANYFATVQGQSTLRTVTSAQVDSYFAGRPPSIDDAYLEQKIAAAVYAALQANPPAAGAPGAEGPAGPGGADGQDGAAGRPPTFQEIMDAVSVYLQAYPPQKGDTGATGAVGAAGPTGATGAAGRAPTAQEIAAAVAAYLTANPPAAGATGPAGQNATDAQVAAAIATYMAANQIKTWVALPDIVLTEGGLVQVAGVRTMTLACAGVRTTDRLSIHPVSHRVNGGAAIAGTPAGYLLGDAVCKADGQITISWNGAALVLATTVAITIRVTAFR